MLKKLLSRVLGLLGYILTTQDELNQTGTRLAMQARTDGIIAGRDIGRLDVLRYNQDSLSPDKFKESAELFNFTALDQKYPRNPVLESLHGKTKTSPRSLSL